MRAETLFVRERVHILRERALILIEDVHTLRAGVLLLTNPLLME
jgi:hypothetical protein